MASVADLLEVLLADKMTNDVRDLAMELLSSKVSNPIIDLTIPELLSIYRSGRVTEDIKLESLKRIKAKLTLKC